MSISQTTTFVATPDERLINDLVLGATSLEKGIGSLIVSKRTKVALNRFFTAVEKISAPQNEPSVTANAGTKDERAITMGGIELYDEFDPRDFNDDWEFLWAQGPDAQQQAAAELERSIISTYGVSFRHDLERAMWRGDTASGSAFLAQFDGWIKQIDADGTVVSVTPQGVITAANVISVLEAVVAAAPEEIQELDSPAILMSNIDKYLYREAARALDFKGTDITDAVRDVFGGYPILSTHGIPAGRMFMTNASSGESGNLKAATWMTSDVQNVVIARKQANSRLWFVKISAEFGTNHVYGKQIVEYTTV